MSKGTALLRQQNEKRTLSYLRIHGISSRLEIAEALGVSKNTVSLIVDKFIKDGIIKEIGTDEQGGVGRPRMQLTLIPEAYKSLGILIQNRQGQFVVTDYHSRVLEKGEIYLDSSDADVCLRQLTDLSQNLLKKHPEVIGIGIGIPGLVDPIRGFVHYSSHLGWSEIPVKENLELELPVPVRVLNSVKAAAFAPVNLIPQSSLANTFYIRIGKGVGGALIIGNEVYNGSSWTAGEIGHLVVKMDGPTCTCGQKGCLESLVSVPVVTEMIMERYQTEHDTDQHPKVLTDILSQKASFIEEVLSETGGYLGIALSQIINLFNPAFIIIDSPFAQTDIFKEAALKTAEERALHFPFKQTSFIFVHTHYSSATGAALAVILDFENESALNC